MRELEEHDISYGEFEDENFVDIHFMSKDRQYALEVDEVLSVLADRINKCGEEKLKGLLRVIEAYLEGGDENVPLDPVDKRTIIDALIHYRVEVEERLSYYSSNGIAPLRNEPHELECINRSLEKIRKSIRKVHSGDD